MKEIEHIFGGIRVSQIPVSGNIGFLLLFSNAFLPLLVRTNKKIDFIGFNKKIATVNQVGLFFLTFLHVDHSTGLNVIEKALLYPSKNSSFILYALNCFTIVYLLYVKSDHQKSISFSIFILSFIQLGLSFINLINSEFSMQNMSNQLLSIAFFLNCGAIAPQTWVAEYLWKSSN